MLSWLIRRKIDGFQKNYSYDMDYMRDVLDASLPATMTFHKATGLGRHREDLPKDAWYAAKLVSMLREDCGPCTQLLADMATHEGVSPETIRAVLKHDRQSMSDDVGLTVDFAIAVLARDPSADGLRREVVDRFGRRGLVTLAFALLSSKLYPTLKYALGYGHACSVVHVDGAAVATPREAF